MTKDIAFFQVVLLIIYELIPDEM